MTFFLLNAEGKKIEFPGWGLGLYGAAGAYRDEDKLSVEPLASLLEVALRKGHTLVIDTAAMYGASPGEGEAILGEALKLLKAKGIFDESRHFISTKCGFEFINGALLVDNSAEKIQSSTERSLRHLGVKALGILWLHRRDPHVSVKDIVAAMLPLLKSGKVLNVGLSEVGASTAVEFQQALAAAGYADRFAGVQGEYSVMNRFEQAIVDVCVQNAWKFFAYGTLKHGFLTDRVSCGKVFEGIRAVVCPQFDEMHRKDNLALREALEAFAQQKGWTLPQLCFAWAKAQGVIPLIGTSNLDHLRENLAKIDERLSDSDLEQAEAICATHPTQGARVAEMFARLAPEIPT